MSPNQDPLLDYRDRFPILSSTNYLISNSLGAMPAKVRESLYEYAQTWATRGVRAWEEGWWTLAADLGNLVAPLLGASSGDIVFQPCVTIAHAILFGCFDFSKRNRVVTDAMHFPSILYLIEGLKGQGASIEVVPTDDGITIDAGRIIDSINQSTAFVSISHVLFKSAYIQDVKVIATKAREVGAITIIDGYQAVGTIPVDVNELGVDVYIGGCLKWLCGGPGAAFLWVRPDLRDRLTPKLTGWMSHKRPFAFEPEIDRRTDAWRYLIGTPSIPSLYAARPGLEIINEIGIEAIRKKSIHQTALLIDLALSRGYSVTSPTAAEQRGGTAAIQLEHGLEISRALKAKAILCDYRPGAGVRLSPHFTTRDEELREAIVAINDIVADRSWQHYPRSDSAVT
jgi:kynureninase